MKNDDLVERGRKLEEHLLYEAGGDEASLHYYNAEVCHHMTNAIEALEKERDDYKQGMAISDGMMSSAMSRAEKLEAENKRLREALEFYADPNRWSNDTNRLLDHELGWRQARAALGEKKDG